MCLGEEETQMNHIIRILFVLGAIVQNSRRTGKENKTSECLEVIWPLSARKKEEDVKTTCHISCENENHVSHGRTRTSTHFIFKCIF